MITGCSGLIGSHLADFLLENTDYEIYAIEHPRIEPYRPDEVTYYQCDITDTVSVYDVFKKVQPDYIYHLAGQSFFGVGQSNPLQTIDINVNGTMNIFEAIRRQGTVPSRILVASSASIYGKPNHIPTSENESMKPLGIYATSKVATDALCYQYYMNYSLPIIALRPFIQVGTRQGTGNSINSFAKQIAEIEKNSGKGVIRVGNLTSIRDFTDVRDCVKAIWLLTKEGVGGEAYNICSGVKRKMSDILDELIALSDAEITIEIDTDRLRPSDSPIEQGSNHKINSLTGWQPEIKFEDTLKDILDYWRCNI
jgi:GDP-4-dehydro-6-deoxy-D-mannose reductase